MMNSKKELKPLKIRFANWKPNYWIAPSIKNLTVAITSDEIEQLVQGIILTSCKYFNVDQEDVLSKKRNREFMAARYFIIYLIREKTNLSLGSIGKIVGRDHTTCIYAIDEIRKQLTNPFDDTYSNDLKKLKSII